jgi:hypothetical protein
MRRSASTLTRSDAAGVFFRVDGADGTGPGGGGGVDAAGGALPGNGDGTGAGFDGAERGGGADEYGALPPLPLLSDASMPIA